MSKCVYHQGREAVMLYGGKYYCAKCRAGIDDARLRVCGDIEPRECFVMFHGGDTWKAITGTGCAHYVAYKRGIRNGGEDERCLLGYTLRIPDLIASLSTRSLDHGRRDISRGDIYVTADHSHCGWVTEIEEHREPRGTRTITIENDSSNSSCTGRGVVEDDLDEHFHGRGEFYW